MTKSRLAGLARACRKSTIFDDASKSRRSLASARSTDWLFWTIFIFHDALRSSTTRSISSLLDDPDKGRPQPAPTRPIGPLPARGRGRRPNDCDWVGGAPAAEARGWRGALSGAALRSAAVQRTRRVIRTVLKPLTPPHPRCPRRRRLMRLLPPPRRALPRAAR